MKLKSATYQNEAYILNEVDTMNFITKSSTKEQRKKFDIGDIYINAAVCLHCKEYIRSKNRHDFKRCKCGKIAVDGGSQYCKRVGNQEDMISIIETFYDSINE